MRSRYGFTFIQSHSGVHIYTRLSSWELSTQFPAWFVFFAICCFGSSAVFVYYLLLGLSTDCRFADQIPHFNYAHNQTTHATFDSLGAVSVWLYLSGAVPVHGQVEKLSGQWALCIGNAHGNRQDRRLAIAHPRLPVQTHRYLTHVCMRAACNALVLVHKHTDDRDDSDNALGHGYIYTHMKVCACPSLL